MLAPCPGVGRDGGMSAERLRALQEALQRSFWFLPGIGMVLGLALGFALPVIDEGLSMDFGLFSFDDASSARSLLETIATVMISVAAVGFSVSMVAFTLASQQLGPRVLRTFQRDRLSQSLLAVFLGTFAYCLIVLSTLDLGGQRNLSLAVAILAALGAFAVFVSFIHHAVISLQPSTLIRRMAADGQAAIARRYPAQIGGDPQAPPDAERRARERMAAGGPIEIRARRAGFLTELYGEGLMKPLERAGGLVVQRARLGDFVVTGGLMGELWLGRDADRDRVIAEVTRSFRLNDERTVVHDVAFPVRQLADVALRGLSPSLNDPTTAENAMNSLTDTLVRFAAQPPAPAPRVDAHEEPRVLALAPDLDDLVRLGFEQVRVKAATYPVVSARLLVLLGEIERAAGEHDVPCGEVARQTRLLREGAEGNVPTQADVEAVATAPGAGGAQPPRPSSADARSATSESATSS